MFDLESPVPYHFQIKDVLKQEIADGLYDEKIPSERELIVRFSVSRTTIREAINHLVHEGILEKIHGKGTFISKSKQVHEWLHTINSLTDTIKRMGMQPSSRLLLNQPRNVSEHISQYMNSADLHLIKRLRTADSMPIAIEYHYYHPALGEALSAFDLNTITIYEVIENELNIVMDEAEQSITCKPILADDAKQLEIEQGTNVLYVDRLIKDAGGKPIEYYTSVVKPEMYVFRLKMKKQGR